MLLKLADKFDNLADDESRGGRDEGEMASEE